jgi:hypothetical protein
LVSLSLSLSLTDDAGSPLLASIFHLLASTCWLPSRAYWLLPVGFHIYLACLFSLSPAGCRLLASTFHLLTCACWLPALSG